MPDCAYQGAELDLFEGAENWKRYWCSHVRPFIRGTVLEVGAGTGNNTRFLEGLEYSKWICLEPDLRQCAELSARLGQGRQIEVVSGTVRDLPAQARFDAILYLDVLEHIEDDEAEMRRACRHLNPEGTLIVLAPAHRWLYSPFDQSVGHLRRYCSRSLREAAPRELSLVFLRYLDAAGVVASMGNRLLLRRGMPTAQQLRVWDRCLVPISRQIDKALGYRLGKSILGVWRKAPPGP